MKSRTIHLGISTCPNDTFAFHGLLEGRIETPGLSWKIELLDVEELNGRLATGDFDVAKGSYHAALLLAEELVALPSGSALGFGVGPLLLAAPGRAERGDPATWRVLTPGRYTTAALLFRLFHPEVAKPKAVIFSDIMPMLRKGEADWGVCIHEGRFTYRDSGLELVEDLGERWEESEKTPLPLGGIFARRALGDELIAKVQDAVRRSLLYAREHPEEARATMRRHAQELDDPVIDAHVELYVNDWTLDLGKRGREALNALDRRARGCGFVPEDHPPLEVFTPPCSTGSTATT